MGHSNSIVPSTEHLHNGKNQTSSERQAFYRKLSEKFPNYFDYRELDYYGFKNNLIHTKFSTIRTFLSGSTMQEWTG